ncbi:MAG: hypothetical protein AB1Z23_04965 [Eubacteriales bacterium]
MLKLLKYELKKRVSTLITFVILLLAAEGLALYLINKGREYAVLGSFVIGLMFFGVVLLAFLDVAIQYYGDFKKSQGTLLFLTPNNGFKIVGSKMLFGAMELFLGIGIVALLAWAANSFAVSKGLVGIEPELAKLKEIMELGYGEGNVGFVIAGFLFLVFLQYLTTQSIAVSSITLGRTILSKNQYNWFWAVLLFIGVSIGVQTLNGLVIMLIGMGDGLFSSTFIISAAEAETSAEVSKSIGKIIFAGGMEYIFWIILSFFVSSMLLNKKVDI